MPLPILEAARGGVLCRMGSDLSSMGREELCHNRCMGLLLAECMQDIGAGRLDAKTRCTGSGLKSGVCDLNEVVCRDPNKTKA